jgi:hypothetical protein
LRAAARWGWRRRGGRTVTWFELRHPSASGIGPAAAQVASAAIIWGHPFSRAVQDVVGVFPGGESSRSARAARYMAIACVGSRICRADSCSIFPRR